MCSCLLLSPSYIAAQNPDRFLTFESCTIGFLYPEEWKNFINHTNSSNCEESYTEIIFPQPSLSEKITPHLTIIVEPCCVYITPRDAYVHQNISR